MPIWWRGFATRAGADRAAVWGSLACWFQAVRETLGSLYVLSFAEKPVGNAIAYFFGASLLPIFLIVAGIRLWQKSGWILASLAAAFVFFELLAAMITTYPQDYYTALLANFGQDVPIAAKAALIGSFATKVAIVLLMFNGARAAFALRRSASGDAERSTT